MYRYCSKHTQIINNHQHKNKGKKATSCKMHKNRHLANKHNPETSN